MPLPPAVLASADVASPAEVASRHRRLADLLVVLVIAYSAKVLSPDLAPQDFSDIELASHVAATSESNLANQLFWLLMGGLAFVVALPAWRRLQPILASSFFLVALVALALASPLWALEPSIAMRRVVQQAIIVFALFVAAGASRTPEHCLRVCYATLAFCLLAYLLSLALPVSFDWRGDFRGIYGDKNGLGALAVMALLMGACLRPTLRSSLGRRLNLVYLAGWLAIAVLTRSKTSLGLLVAVPAVVLALHLAARATRLSIGLYLTLGLLSAGALLLFVVEGVGITPERLLGAIHVDATFTGRTEIWQFAFAALADHWGLGYGYQSFWNAGPASPNLQAEVEFIRYLNQAHNGYLDILLALGVGGLLLAILALAQTIINLSRIRLVSPVIYWTSWCLLVFVLIHNMTESSLLRGYSPPWIFLLLAIALASRVASKHCAEDARP
ncbi:MAG: O-antigen ligase family protein [Geminicoccaceae bacterium]